ncbi:hypothetical protein ACPCXE_19910, partial [Bacillus velezensis]|uniref:hypothetical protein n=1 Tax=Bacillus velezensis TaxID=492670 RepID=UPI003C1683C1
RGFLQARAAFKKEGQELGEVHLYFGHRNDHDFLSHAELEAYEKDGIVTLQTAFSRKEGVPKTYGQHLRAKDAGALISILGRGGHLYV